MGMFDFVRCKLPLPVGQDWLYQTKSTDRQGMMNHTITEEGRLILHDVEYEVTPDEERPYADRLAGMSPEDPKYGLYSMIGSIRQKTGSERDVDQNFDGDLVFYPDGEHITGGKSVAQFDYRATFRDGVCQEICQKLGWYEPNPWTQVWKR